MTTTFASTSKSFIVSAGRTGTQFFADTLGPLVDGCLSIHEPDKIDFHSLPVRTMAARIRQQGVWRPVVRKFLGTSGARNHSLNRLAGRLNGPEAITRLSGDRHWLPQKLRLYVESNYQLYGMVDDLLQLPLTRIVVVTRAADDWIRSWRGKRWYSQRDLLSRLDVLGMRRLSPQNVGVDEPDWETWNRSSKLAWVWCYMNSLLLSNAETNPSAIRVVRFEDIFVRQNREIIEQLLGFVTHDAMNDKSKDEFVDKLSVKINANPSKVAPQTEPIISSLTARIDRLQSQVDAIAMH